VTPFSFMLDTNILSHMIRFPTGPALACLEKVGEQAVCTSAIVASEFRFGAAKRASPRLTKLVEQMLERFAILPYDAEASSAYAQIRNDLATRGEMIGPADLFIAAHARSLNLKLVTDDVREFSRVEDLKVENWLDGEDRT
jgi:tRNA(fMet)-specific endonuclease VapC